MVQASCHPQPLVFNQLLVGSLVNLLVNLQANLQANLRVQVRGMYGRDDRWTNEHEGRGESSG